MASSSFIKQTNSIVAAKTDYPRNRISRSLEITAYIIFIIFILVSVPLLAQLKVILRPQNYS